MNYGDIGSEAMTATERQIRVQYLSRKEVVALRPVPAQILTRIYDYTSLPNKYGSLKTRINVRNLFTTLFSQSSVHDSNFYRLKY
jgi:hypothetical protein